MENTKISENVYTLKIKERLSKLSHSEKVSIITQLMNTEIKGFYVNTTQYAKYMGLTLGEYKNYIKMVEKANPEFYAWYVEQKYQNKEMFVDSAKETILFMNELVVNGVLLEDGTTRNFDVIDCYAFIKNYLQGFGRRNLSQVLNSLELEYRDDPNINFGNIRQLLGCAYFDGNNYNNVFFSLTPKHILNDDSYKLSMTEKQQLINYFNINNIPYNLDTYYAVVQRINNSKNKKQNNYFSENYKTKRKKA